MIEGNESFFLQKAATLSCLILILFAILSPWVSNNYLNPDLTVAADVVSNMDDFTWLDAFADNSLMLLLLQPISNYLGADIAVRMFQNVCVMFLGYCVLKYLDPFLALSFILFFFFSLLLNQFRFALALSLGFVVLGEKQETRKVFLGLLLIGAVCAHFFGGIAIAFIKTLKVTQKHNSKLWKVAFGATASVLSSLVIFVFVDEGFRFSEYLSTAVPEYPSFTFVFSGVFVVLFWSRLSTLERAILAIGCVGSGLILNFPALSGRIAEFVVIIAFLLMCGRQARRIEQNLVLVVAFAFFAYRFSKWVLLDQIPGVTT